MTEEFLEESLAQGHTSPFMAGSLMTVDIGSVNTRAALYDMVEGRYRFLAAGAGITTAGSPLFDASEGVRLALDQIHDIAGRTLFGEDGQVIVPSTEDGAGADYIATTISAGAPLKTVVVGLLDKVSLISAANLAGTSYSEIIETISLNDRRKPEEQIDTIQKLRPDVILIAGGTENGASQSVLRMVNSVGMALYLLPERNRPEVLYAGNSALASQVKKFIEPLADIHIAPNIRPSLAGEQLGPAQAIFTDIFRRIQTARILGLAELNTWSAGNLLPTPHGLGRVVRFYSKIVPNPTEKGVLAVDVGASSTIVAAGFNGDLRIRTFPKLGTGEGLEGVLEGTRLENVLRWLPVEIPPAYVVDYIQNKITHPSTLPATPQDLFLEHALAREIIGSVIKQAGANFPKNAQRVEGVSLPIFDPIIIGGGVLANAPSPAQSLLIALDALQPAGIFRVILDKNNLSPGLGAAAATTPALVTQLLLDPTAFLNLGFVIAPVSKARQGTSILRVRIQYETGHENVINVHQGNIQAIPLPIGQRAKLYLDPLHRANIGLGMGKSTAIQVVGGPFGVVVDARSRPLQLPKEPETRRNLLRKWQTAFSKRR